jgi:hypothetical protein
MTPNAFIERMCRGKPGRASHPKRYSAKRGKQMDQNFQYFDEIETVTGGLVLLIDRVGDIKNLIRVQSAMHGGSNLKGWSVTVVADGGGLFRPRTRFGGAHEAEAFAERVVRSSNASYRAG